MNNDYLVKKKPMYALFVFALPIIIGNIFQQTYTMADSAIVGRFVSEKALAAVGASYSLTNIFICVAIGGGIGASVIVSRYFGAKEYKKTKTAVYTALIAFTALSVLLGIIGLVFSRLILIALNTPSDVLDLAVDYLNIYFAGLPFLFMYNVLSAMFNALGKSKIPLYFLIFSSVFNVALDLLLVKNFSMGVTGVAWATLIAQGISVVLSFIVLVWEFKKLNIGRAKFFEKSELLPMAKIAFPSIIQQSTVSIGMMLVQSVVNGFGSEALAGYSAAIRVESLCIVPFNSLIVSMFLGDDGTITAMNTGCGYLSFMGWFFCFIGFKMAVDGLLRGAGDMKMFTVANFVNLFIRVFVAMAFAPIFGLQMVWIAVPIGWFSNWIISFLEYRTGKWKRIYKR